MLVNVFSDYSGCQRSKISTFGCVYTSDRGTGCNASRMKSFSPNTNIMESRAAANALRHALNDGVCMPGDVVFIRLDNEAAVNIINGEFDDTSTDVSQWFFEARQKYELTIIAGLVRGHSNSSAYPARMNGKCHDMAISLMRQIRNA